MFDGLKRLGKIAIFLIKVHILFTAVKTGTKDYGPLISPIVKAILLIFACAAISIGAGIIFIF
jgi:hypothetical protein